MVGLGDGRPPSWQAPKPQRLALRWRSAARACGVLFLDAFRASFSKALARGHGLHDFRALYEAFVAE